MISPEVLRRYPYFAGVSEESLKQVAMMTEERSYPAGHVLFQEGDPATHMSIIQSGEVSIQYLLGSGELRTVDTLVGGDILGWSALVEPYRMTALASASQSTHLIRIEAMRLRDLCEKDPRLGYQLLMQVAKLLGNRLDGARVQLAVVG
ncbi:MAG: cyclic nucleotide-binding domain-containing protein [Planctomycetota bacterium]